MKILNFNQLSNQQIEQYRKINQNSWPKIILNSDLVKTTWQTIETYFPSCQLFAVSEDSNIIGYMNLLPFFREGSLYDLSDDGWDWLVAKGIADYESNRTPNCLGGLQVVIDENHRGNGYSKLLIKEGKERMKQMGFDHLVIPIRPTFKHKHPNMEMKDYMIYEEESKIYDPWIRTHISSGAEIIKVCENSMNVKGDIEFWQTLVNIKIDHSGSYAVDGALNPVQINVEENYGEYREDNIWISYS